MENKRSVGVTVFAWIFIIFGIFGLMHLPIGMYLDRNLPPTSDFGTPRYYFNYILNTIFSLCSFIGGIFILRLKNWARRLIVILRLVGIATLIIYLPLKKEAINNFDSRLYRLQEENLRRADLEKIERSLQVSKKNFNTLYIMVFVISLGWRLIIIYFFTRPKVKEQFR